MRKQRVEKTCTREPLCITDHALSSIMMQFRLHRCGRRGVRFFDDRAIVALCSYDRKACGRALNYVVRMAKNSNTLSERLSLACRRNGSARQTRRGRRKEERERRRRKKEGRRKKEDRRIHLGVTS